jgi:hypothetical protein
MDYGPEDVQNRVSLLFFLLMMAYISAQPYLLLSMCLRTLVLVVLCAARLTIVDCFVLVVGKERTLTYHEQDAQLYGTFPYYLGILMSSIPLSLIYQLIFVTVCRVPTKATQSIGK